MAKQARKKHNGKSAQKLASKSLNPVERLLILVGKPFYYSLSVLLLAFLSLSYITGHSVRVFTTAVFVLLRQLLNKTTALFLDTKVAKKKRIVKKKVTPLLIYPNFGRQLGKTILATRVFLKSHLSLGKKKISPKTIKQFSLSLLRFKLRLIPLARIKAPSLPPLRYRHLLIVGLLLFIASPFGFSYYVIHDTPSPEKLNQRDINLSTKIYDRNGVLLYKIFKDQNRTLIPLGQLPLHVKHATIAAEDSEFYSHPGFSLKGIVRSVIKNSTQGELYGGSTITQQLVKNALLSPEKTFIRKLREVYLAIRVESRFTKDEILEMYLNEVSYGGTAYGIQEAARYYFGKDAQALTLAEAALLAGLPKSPTKYSPHGPNPGLSLARQKEVLRLMQANGFITAEQELLAEKEKIKFASPKTDIKAPHFVMFVRELLEEKYGKAVVEKGGLEVYTSLDYDIQLLAEDVVKAEVSKIRNLNATNGAAVILNPSTGEILAMVGSVDYFDATNDGNVNVTTRPRQPGSSIKVVNYAYALSHGYTPASLVEDSPITYQIAGSPAYTPRNYEGGYRGKLSIRSALAESRNIPAVKVLASYGVDKMIQQGQSMGISTWEDKNRFGLSLTLGAGEIKLIELAQVYATLANYGKKQPLSPILSIMDYHGQLLEKNSCIKFSQEPATPSLGNKFSLTAPAFAAEAFTANCDGQQVVDPRVAFIITDILKDNSARTPAFGSMSQLVISDHPEVAVKTGTSNNLRDNLTLGYDQNYVVAVWVGNNNNSPMNRVASGVTGASPIFNKIMTSLLTNSGSREWSPPPGLVQLPVCLQLQTLGCDSCPGTMEWFLEENKPALACSGQQNPHPDNDNRAVAEPRRGNSGDRDI